MALKKTNETYRLDIKRFSDIIKQIDDIKGFPGNPPIKVQSYLIRDGVEIIVRNTPDKDAFDSGTRIGRLVSGQQIDKNPDSLYLQTYLVEQTKCTGNDLVRILRDFII